MGHKTKPNQIKVNGLSDFFENINMDDRVEPKNMVNWNHSIACKQMRSCLSIMLSKSIYLEIWDLTYVKTEFGIK